MPQTLPRVVIASRWDKHGNAYVVGTTSSSDFPTKNAFQDALETLAGNAFVTKISAK
jgi:Beta-propeller repeat